MNPKIILVIPAYNEEASIEKTIENVVRANYDYIVINDGSTDNTRQILERNKYNHINLISNLGIGGAVQTGYKYALENKYDIVVQFDADGQHDISYIEAIVRPLKTGEADLVIGSCFIGNTHQNNRSSKLRRFGIRFLSHVIKFFSKKRVHDPTSGFRAVNRKVLIKFATNYPLEYPEPISNFELLKYSDVKIIEVPVKMHKRKAGKSSIHSWKNIYAAINVLLSIIIISLGGKHYD